MGGSRLIDVMDVLLEAIAGAYASYGGLDDGASRGRKKCPYLIHLHL